VTITGTNFGAAQGSRSPSRGRSSRSSRRSDFVCKWYLPRANSRCVTPRSIIRQSIGGSHVRRVVLPLVWLALAAFAFPRQQWRRTAPTSVTGRLLRCRFQDLLSVHLRCGPAHSPSRHCDPFHRRLQPASSAPPPLRVLPGGANQFPSGTAPAEDQRLSRRTRIVGDRKLSQRLALPCQTVGGHLAGSSGNLKLSQKDFLSAEGQKNSSPIRRQEWAVSRCSEVRGMRRSKTSKGIRRGEHSGVRSTPNNRVT